MKSTKAYFSFKLLVVFVIVLLLSLPYAFAGKPEKPPKPPKPEDPQTSYVWNVYIPFNYSGQPNGLQGINVPSGSIELKGAAVLYGNAPLMRHDVAIRPDGNTVFYFEVTYDFGGEYADPPQVQFDGMSCLSDECGSLYNEVKLPQPSGNAYSEFSSSKKVWFGFESCIEGGFNFEDLGPENPPVPLCLSRVWIDNFFSDWSFAIFQIEEIFMSNCDGNSEIQVSRIDNDTWRIESTVEFLDATQIEPEFETVLDCPRGPKSCTEINKFIGVQPVAKVLARIKPFEIYFQRVPE